MGAIHSNNRGYILIFAKKSKRIKNALTEQAYSLAIAKDEADIISLYQEKQPDLVILDDIEIAKQLYSTYKANILFVGRVNQIDAALEAGARDCYTGVIHPRILNKRIDSLIPTNRRNRQPQIKTKQYKSSDAEFYRKVFEAANDGILLIDAESSKIVNANLEAARMLGYTRDELLSKTIEDIEQITDSDKQPRGEDSTRQLIVETFYKRHDGSLLPIESSSRLMIFEGRPLLVSFLRNISERKRVYEAERQQRILADTLRENVAKISSTLDLNEVFNHLLSAIKILVPYDGANIMLIENEHLKIEYTLGYEINLVGNSYPFEEFPDFATILKTTEPYYIPDTSKFAGWKNFDSLDWIKSNLSVPIIIDGKIIGFLNLDSAKINGFTENHIQWLITFANQASIAIRNARYTSELEKRVQERTQELESETAQLQAILNAMRDGVIYTNMQNEIQYINEALQQITGFAEEDWLAYIVDDKIRTQTAEELEQIRADIDKNLSQRGYWRGIVPLKRKDGGPFEGELTRTLVKNRSIEAIGVLTMLRDVSNERLLEEQKRRFIATAAHELRTPISNLKTRMFLMRRMPEKFMEHLSVSESVVNLMQNLVEAMFDLGRFERGIIKLEREDLILQNLLKDIIQYQEPEADHQQITLSLYVPEPPITIFADPYRLTQAVINLVANALHHTHSGGKVCVKLECTHTDVLLKVTDNGEGISAEHLEHLFEPFYRISNDKNGAGLGLAIVHEIVSLHEGTITADSEVGKGSTFTIKLPLNKLSSPARDD